MHSFETMQKMQSLDDINLHNIATALKLFQTYPLSEQWELKCLYFAILFFLKSVYLFVCWFVGLFIYVVIIIQCSM